jgi:hypothetical protein
MYSSPNEAFTEFLTMMGRTSSKYQPSTEDFFHFLEPFLANPERHRKHVYTIIDAARAAAKIPVMQWPLKRNKMPSFQMLSTWWSIRKIPSLIEAWVKELQELKDTLELKQDPVDLHMDFLPFTAIETDPSWKDMNKGAMQSISKISVQPSDKFIVEKVSLHVDFGDSQVQVITATPESEIEILGERQTARGESLTQIEGNTTSGSLSIAAKSFGSIGFTDSHTTNKKYAETASAIMKDSVNVPKVICSDVGSRVSWDLYSTPNQVLMGGFSFSVHLLVPFAVSELTVTAQLVAQLSSWGPSQKRYNRKLATVFMK